MTTYQPLPEIQGYVEVVLISWLRLHSTRDKEGFERSLRRADLSAVVDARRYLLTELGKLSVHRAGVSRWQGDIGCTSKTGKVHLLCERVASLGERLESRNNELMTRGGHPDAQRQPN